MKVKVARTRKVTEAVEDGYAVFNGGQWFTSYQIPGSEGKKSELSGIYVIDGKPYMGKDN